MSIADTAIHEIDELRWLLGQELAAVEVRTPRKSGRGGELQDPLLVLFEMADGVLVDVEVSVNVHYGYEIRCEVSGETGTVELADLIVTPMGGLTLGEPMVQTSAFLRAGSPGLAGRIMAFVLNPLESINTTLEGTRPYGEEPSDPYGVPLAYPHTLEFQVGAANARFAGNGDRSELLFGGRAEVDTRADLPVPGRDHRLVAGDALNEQQ